MVGRTRAGVRAMHLGERIDTDLPDAPAPGAPVYCGLCRLPVVQSRSHPPVLMHQVASYHGNGSRNAIDYYFPGGACPQEGMPIPAESADRIPPATVGPPDPAHGPPKHGRDA